MPVWRVLAVAWAMAAGAESNYGCSVCGCSLSSDWASQGYLAMPGLQADLRYEYYNQSELRAGTHAADRSAFALPNDEEIQQRTLNRNGEEAPLRHPRPANPTSSRVSAASSVA